jgi:hypothetical protein
MVTVQAVGDHGPKPDLGGDRVGDQRGGLLGFGPKRWILLAGGQPARRGVGRQADRPVDLLVGPQATDHHDAPVDLAELAEVLAGHVRGLGAVFGVAGVVDDQHPARVRRGRGIGAQQSNPAGVDRVGVPDRLRHEELQPLGLGVAGAGDRFGVGQSGERLVALAWRQQPGQVVPEPAPLRQPP